MALTEELKQSILLSAMSGKLTVQNSVLENAQDIVDSIIERNTQNSKRIKTMPAIALEELPFDIPDNWRWVRLSDLTENLSDGIHGTPLFDETGDYFFINGNNLVNGKIVIKKDTQRVCEAEYLKYRKPLTDNTVLLSINGTIGNTAYYNNEPVILGKSACYIALHPEMNKEYFRLILETRFFLMYGATKATQTTIKNLSLKAMRLFPVPVPPLEEQQRIVECVNMLMGKLDEFSVIEQQLITLKANFPADMRGAILQAAMQGKLTEQLESDSAVDVLLSEIKPPVVSTTGRGRKKSKQLDMEFFDIPENWKWVKLSECGTTNIGLTYSPSDVTVSGGTVVLRSSNIQNGQMAYDDIVTVNMKVPENKMCHIGDILICARNGSKRLVGKSAIIDKEGMAFGAFMAIYRSKCNPYINYVLDSPHFRKSVLGGAETVTINQVTQDMIENYMVPLPPIEEQQRIVERLDTLLPLCDTLME